MNLFELNEKVTNMKKVVSNAMKISKLMSLDPKEIEVDTNKPEITIEMTNDHSGETATILVERV